MNVAKDSFTEYIKKRAALVHKLRTTQDGYRECQILEKEIRDLDMDYETSIQQKDK